METSDETSKTSGAKAAFNRACARLMVFGPAADVTAPGAPPALGVIREAARRIRGAWAKLFGEAQTPDGKTIEAWATKSVPHPEAFGRLCQVIFGKAHDGHESYRAFDALWKAARAKPAPPVSTAASAQTPAVGTSFRDLEWIPHAFDQPNGFVVLRVHRPDFMNEPPDTPHPTPARLPITLSFSSIEETVSYRNRKWHLRLGLSQAVLRPKWIGCQPVFRSNSVPNGTQDVAGSVEQRAGFFHIQGPKSDDMMLSGEPFAGEPACVLEPSGTREPLVTLTLTSTANDVVVTAASGAQPVGTVKEKLAKAWLLHRKTKTTDGRTIVWSKATLRGRKRA